MYRGVRTSVLQLHATGLRTDAVTNVSCHRLTASPRPPVTRRVILAVARVGVHQRPTRHLPPYCTWADALAATLHGRGGALGAGRTFGRGGERAQCRVVDSLTLFSLAVVACGVVHKGLRPISAGADRVGDGVSIRPTRTRRAARKWMLAYPAHHTPLDTLTLPHGSTRGDVDSGGVAAIVGGTRGRILAGAPGFELRAQGAAGGRPCVA